MAGTIAGIFFAGFVTLFVLSIVWQKPVPLSVISAVAALSVAYSFFSMSFRHVVLFEDRVEIRLERYLSFEKQSANFSEIVGVKLLGKKDEGEHLKTKRLPTLAILCKSGKTLKLDVEYFSPQTTQALLQELQKVIEQNGERDSAE